MSEFRIRTRYVTHPGSNVGAILATAAGRRMRVRRDQALNFDVQHEQVAAAMADRMGWHLTGPRTAPGGGVYVFEADAGRRRPCLECGRPIGYPVPVGDGSGRIAWVCDGHAPTVRARNAEAGEQ